MSVEPLVTQAYKTKTLLRVATHLLKYDREMPLSRLQILLLVCHRGREGILVKELKTSTGLNQSTVARAISHLGDKPLRGQKDPLRWIEANPDVHEPRRVRITITDRGRQVIEEIENLI